MLQSKRLVICCINSKYIHSSLAPWCLLAGIKANCKTDITAEVAEGTINEKEEEIAERLILKDPDILSFCCYIWNIRQVKKIAGLVKKALPKVVIIFGGPEVSFNPGQILSENDFVDFVLSGEGEEVLPKIVDLLVSKEKIKGKLASYRNKNEIIYGEYQTAKAEYSPYCEEYFSSLEGRIAYIESSRGCPYSCAFCLSGTDKKVRFFNLERVKKEILSLSNTGTKTVKFIDRTFNCNKRRAADILLFIKENYGSKIPESVCFHFEIAADILDGELLDIISKMPTGSVQFEAGIQSFNEKTLAKINRKTDIDKLCENTKKLVSFRNCHVHIDLISGLPFETLDSFKQSFNKAFSLKADMLQLGFLKILYGSCMERNKEDFPCEYSAEPPYEVVSTKWLSKDEINFLHIFEDAFERLCNSGRFKRTVGYILDCTGKEPFDVFSDFALFAYRKKNKNPALDIFTEWVFEFFKEYENVDKAVLRDRMIEDRLATNSSGIIPKCLQIRDNRLKTAKYVLSKLCPLEKGIMRSAAILYTSGSVVMCDYLKKDRVSGEYDLTWWKLNEILEG